VPSCLCASVFFTQFNSFTPSMTVATVLEVGSMSLAGRGIVAIWHDIVLEGQSEFYEWHNREHMPERMGIPGFRRGRRYVALHGTPQFFCFYEGDDLNVVAGPEYLQRLNNPSQWTRKMMPYFRNMSRSVCNLRYSEGAGEGGFVATKRFSASSKNEDALCDTVLPRVGKAPGIVGVHLCVADGTASNIPTKEKTFRTATDMCPPHVVMIEGSSASFVRAAGETLLSELPGDLGVYQLENTRSNLEGAYNLGFKKANLVGTNAG
jgi:hypothetical protein